MSQQHNADQCRSRRGGLSGKNRRAAEAAPSQATSAVPVKPPEAVRKVRYTSDVNAASACALATQRNPMWLVDVSTGCG
jgi:hypothetical protein